MNLYRKYRPKKFEDIIGNEAEIESFQKLLSKENKPHAFAIFGPSGCGKTTLARIAAEHLGADELNISEINTADNRGIDTARELGEQMKYMPMNGKPRVYIIDEVHGTTTDWKRAMLKPLEDMPDHVYFFLCTTNEKKLFSGDEGKAIKTRCTKIKVESLDDENIYRLLRRVCIAEEKEIDKDILRELSENCEGSPRQALVLLEKIIDMTDKQSMLKVISMSEEEEKETLDLCRALSKANEWDTIKHILNKLKEVDPEKIRYAVLGYMNSILLKSKHDRAAYCIECFSEPFYNKGKAGVTLACYQTLFGE
jgi:DNA polymerase-3 subunit gamma/tau